MFTVILWKNFKTWQMNRLIIVINLTCTIIIVAFFELVKSNKWDPQLLIYEIIPLLVLVVTYTKAIKKTGLWKLTHLKLSDLDKSQKSAYLNAVNAAYVSFSILISSTLLLYTLLKMELNMVLIMAFVYLAHILPAYFMGWTK
jgi:hypothetical protein